jgi:hypothetical protein
MINIELSRELGGGVAVYDAELAPGAVAIGVHRRFRHAELARNLLRGQVLVDEAQAFTLSRCEQSHRIFGDDVPWAHGLNTKRRLELHVYFNAKTQVD